MPGFNFLRENRNILICWSYMPCCAFYLCDTNSHEIIKTSDYFRLHWKSRIKLSCGPAEDSALFFPSKSFEISVFFGFKTVKVFLNRNYKAITLHTCSPYSGLLPVVKNTIITLLCEINKNGLHKLTLLHFISTKQAGDRNIKKRFWHSSAREYLVRNGIILTPLTLCKQNINRPK